MTEKRFNVEGCKRQRECFQINCQLDSAIEAALEFPTQRAMNEARSSILNGELHYCPIRDLVL